MPHSVSPEGEEGILPDAPQSSIGQQNEGSSENKVAPTLTVGLTKEDMDLEDIFDAEDSDPSIPPSSPPGQASGPASQQVPTGFDAKSSDPEVMRIFYQRLFPFRYLFQWLNHSPSLTNDFAHREFAFTLQNDAYLRYQSFNAADAIRKQCVQMIPARFEIGPVYSTNPRDRKTLRKASAFRPISKELVFDIDMTDYDEIRMCCTGAKICHRCWTFITMAIKVVDAALREDFGFEHIMWVYSGRRGAHAWVCDKRAREMDDGKRRAIAGYLELIKGGDASGKKVNVKRPLHPHLERSLNILKEHFQNDILIDQDPWINEEKSAHLLKLLPDKSLNAALNKKWDSAPDRPSTAKWADIDSLASSGASSNLDSKGLKEAKQDIVLEYTYPRLDAEVSKKLNHLLKSPFCIHPGTGRVCVPIDTSRLEEFDPFEVPTAIQLLNEIDEWERSNPNEPKGTEGDGSKRTQDWEKTSLKPYVEQFRNFVNGLLKEERDIKRERDDGDDDAMEF